MKDPAPFRARARAYAGSGLPRETSVFETVVVCLLVGVLVTVVMTMYRSAEDKARRAALSLDLDNIRLAVRLYNILNKKYPDDLRALTRESYLYPDEAVLQGREGGRAGAVDGLFTRKYLEGRAMDTEGYPLDPWGRRFVYDPGTGEIRAGDHGDGNGN